MKRKLEDIHKEQNKKKKIPLILPDVYIFYHILKYLVTLEDYVNISLLSKQFKEIMDYIMIEYIYKTMKYFPEQKSCVYYNNIDLSPVSLYFGFKKDLSKLRTSTFTYDKEVQNSNMMIFYKDENKISTKRLYQTNYYSRLRAIDQCGIFNVKNNFIDELEQELLKYPLIYNLIHEFDAVVAGSFPLWYVLGCPSNWKFDDIDVWMSSYFESKVKTNFPNKYEMLNVKDSEIEETNESKDDENILDEYNNSMTFTYNKQKIHIIFHKKTIQNIISKFDIDICKCLYDGRNIRIGCSEERLRKKLFEISENDHGEEIRRKRVEKYKNRGFKLIE